MAHHHDSHHSTEKKPVSFAVPFYMAVATLVAILSLTSLGDPCHCKEACGEECKTECKHEKGGHEAEAAHGEKAPAAEHGGH